MNIIQTCILNAILNFKFFWCSKGNLKIFECLFSFSYFSLKHHCFVLFKKHFFLWFCVKIFLSETCIFLVYWLENVGIAFYDYCHVIGGQILIFPFWGISFFLIFFQSFYHTCEGFTDGKRIFLSSLLLLFCFILFFGDDTAPFLYCNSKKKLEKLRTIEPLDLAISTAAGQTANQF